MNATYTIHAADVAQFHKLLGNAQKKADKLGVPAITASISKPFTVESRDRRGNFRMETMVTVTLTGTTPKYAGWKLVGIVSPLKADDGTVLPIITTVPGETVRTNGQARDPLACDHCKVRRDRLESFIVTHDDGTEKQVGRSCLKDFLGDDKMSPAGLAGLMNTLASISNAVAEWHKGPRRFDSESLTLVMACTISCIRNHGWVSAKESKATDGQKVATRVFVQRAMEAVLDEPAADAEQADHDQWQYKHFDALNDMPSAADYAKATEYRECSELQVLLDEKADSSDYFAAIRIIVFAGAVNRKAMGIAVSIVPTLERVLGITTDPLKVLIADARKVSKAVGEIKKRQTFTGLTFIENRTVDRGFENMTIATFVTPERNIIKCFTHMALNPGQVINLKATVTRHSEYKGTTETVVNRPVVNP